MGDSTDILGFDCGGEQWVYEACIPVGKLTSLDKDCEKSTDIRFMEKLITLIEESGIPAPAPIEQRFASQKNILISYELK